MADQVAGVVVNDAQGLCVRADGDLAYAATGNVAGFFTTMAEKACALGGTETADVPTVTLETSTRSILITRVDKADAAARTIAVSRKK